MTWPNEPLPDDIVALFAIAKRVVCRRVCPDDIAKMRKRLRPKAFRRYALIGKSHKHQYANYVVHHIVPLSLGGSNRRDNLALVEPSLEKAIHRFIDLQEKPLLGQRREMFIPMFRGRVWSHG